MRTLPLAASALDVSLDTSLARALPRGADLSRVAGRALAITLRILGVVAIVAVALVWMGGIAALLWSLVSWFADVQYLPAPGAPGWPQ